MQKKMKGIDEWLPEFSVRNQAPPAAGTDEEIPGETKARRDGRFSLRRQMLDPVVIRSLGNP